MVKNAEFNRFELQHDQDGFWRWIVIKNDENFISYGAFESPAEAIEDLSNVHDMLNIWGELK